VRSARKLAVGRWPDKNMKTSTVPALAYGVACVRCRKQTTFRFFRSSVYAFETYRGPTTNDYYRVDLDRIFYQKLVLEDELRRASLEREHGAPLENVPDTMTCPECREPLAVSDDDLGSLPPPAQEAVWAILV